MANISKVITLTEKNDTGPLYDLYWSNDGGTTYTASVDGQNLYLPYVGASAVATVDSSANAFKLTSKGVCVNSQTSGSIIAPTPTPTPTTTAVATGVVLYEYDINSGPGTSASYQDWNGISRTLQGKTFGSGYRFAALSGSFDSGNTTSGAGLIVLNPNFEVYFNTLTITKTANNLTSYTTQLNTGNSNYVSDSSGPYTTTQCIVSGSEWETYDPTSVLSLTLGGSCPVPTPTPTPTGLVPTPTPTPTATGTFGLFGQHTINHSALYQHKSVWNGSSNMYLAQQLITYLTGQSSPATSTAYPLSHANYEIYDSTNVERASWTSASGTALYFFDGVQAVVQVDNVFISGSYVNGSYSSLDVWKYLKY